MAKGYRKTMPVLYVNHAQIEMEPTEDIIRHSIMSAAADRLMSADL
jgi:hypothetical protein